jgi:pyruvate formate lyase activating enzyme
MDIKGAIDLSFVDWDGKVSFVLFLSHCNFRCPFCHNAALVLHPEKAETTPFERVETYLNKRRNWIDGVCITGGEPTLHRDLPELCSKLKKMGFLIKIDTNGTNPAMVKGLIEKGLVDYIAMDIKAPLTVKKYSKAIGVNAEKFLGKVKETVETLLRSGVDYEFRTTVVPTIHKKKEDIEEICRSIKGCKKYVLQKFDVSLGKETLDPDFRKLKPFTDEEMQTLLTIAKKFLPNTKLR